MYADDTAIVVNHKRLAEAEKLMQRFFNNLLKWSHDNGLVVNSCKTKLLHIRSPQLTSREVILVAHNNMCLHVNMADCLCDSLVKNVPHHRYLGVTIDHRMKWDVHIHNLINKLRGASYNIIALRNYLDENTLRSVYCSLIESHVRYGLLSWGNTTRTYVERVDWMQSKVLKAIVGGRRSTVVRIQLFKHFNVLPASELFKFSIIDKFGLHPAYRKTETHDYPTRYQIFTTSRYTNDYGRQLLAHIVPALLNKLPPNIRQIQQNKEFKRTIKAHFYLNSL